MAKKRLFLVIDGSNLYHRLKELRKAKFDQVGFDYEGLGVLLAGRRRIVDKAYYEGAVREEVGSRKSRELMREQHRLIGKLIKLDFRIELGYLLKSGDRYQEKGVDVKMALDILAGAYENLYDEVCLVSSDTDLLPVVKKVREMGKVVEYIGFSHRPSFGLIKNVSEFRLLRLEEIKQFYKKMTPNRRSGAQLRRIIASSGKVSR